MKQEGVPTPAIRRICLYLRQLEAFRSRKLTTVSSKQLGDALGLSDAQVRKDLAYFGQFGHAGIGYRVEELIERCRHILGTDRTWNVILIGAGNLGRALSAYEGFDRRGFKLVAVFDSDPEKAGQSVPGAESLVIRPLDELAKAMPDLDAKLGILAVPAAAAQQVADRLVDAGIKGILNFAPISLAAPDDVQVSNVDLAVQLEQLPFALVDR